MVDQLLEAAVESFVGIANPFSLRPLASGERVVDVGSGAGFDSVLAARQVGPQGRVVGIDMTAEMLVKARRNAADLDMRNVEFREGYAEDIPVTDGPMWCSRTGCSTSVSTSVPCSPRSCVC
jgi:SAM-dependent methyltransferase